MLQRPCQAPPYARLGYAENMGHVGKQKSGIITHQQQSPLVFAEARKTLLDPLELQFRIILRRLRNAAVHRRSDRVLSFLLQAMPAAAIAHGGLTERSGCQGALHVAVTSLLRGPVHTT